MDANMRNVTTVLSNLKSIALDMNAELNLQKTVIDDVDKLVGVITAATKIKLFEISLTITVLKKLKFIEITELFMVSKCH